MLCSRLDMILDQYKPGVRLTPAVLIQVGKSFVRAYGRYPTVEDCEDSPWVNWRAIGGKIGGIVAWRARIHAALGPEAPPLPDGARSLAEEDTP